MQSRFEQLRAANQVPLVGRDEELDLLSRRWAQAKDGDGRVVLLSGEPGIGKSRLIAALLEKVESENATCMRYFCLPHHQGSALQPIVAQLSHAAGFEPRRHAGGQARQARKAAGRKAAPRVAAAVRSAGPARMTARDRGRPAAQARASAGGAARAAHGPGAPRPAADGVRGRAMERPDLARAVHAHGRASAMRCRSC